jgi:hypothetical protein
MAMLKSNCYNEKDEIAIITKMLEMKGGKAMDYYNVPFDNDDSTPDYTAMKDALQMMRAEHSYSCGCGGLGKDALKALDNIIEVLRGYH